MDNSDFQHYNRSERYVREIKKIYQALIKEVSGLMALGKIDLEKPFSFSDYPHLAKQFDKIFRFYAENLTLKIESYKGKEWRYGEVKAYQSAGVEVPKIKIPPVRPPKELSERVWKHLSQYKGELELGLDLSIGKGKSANEIARDLKQYLNEPDRLFRRVRDKHGNLHLSKNAQNYHPGQGVYRSSFKNAQRLARTETNRAYHEASWRKYQEWDFVVGYEVRLSNNPKHCPFCSAMAGKYPKEFKFFGWHPNCRCTTIPILAKDIDNVLESEKITELPKPMRDWLNDNADKIEKAKNKPWFVVENEGVLKDNKIRQDIFNLMGKAKKSEPETITFVNKIIGKFGGKMTSINFKTYDSIFRKVKYELNGDVSQVKDAIRTTIIFDEKTLQKFIHDKDIFSIFTRVKIQIPENFAGYSGVLTNIKTQNEIFAEIQFNTEKMIYAKEKPINAIKIIGIKKWKQIEKEVGVEGGLGHQFYEEMRILDKRVPEQLKKWKELEQKSIDYYSKFR